MSDLQCGSMSEWSREKEEVPNYSKKDAVTEIS
jgi:hypothetical protein